jgi:chromosome segregation ATPase
VPSLERENENNIDRISYLENSLDDLQSRFDSVKINLNTIEEKIKNLELKTQDFSIAELFKGVGSESVGGGCDLSIEIIKSLEKKFDSKMKLNDEKILKLDENNFKLTRQLQNVKNSHDLIKRNIDNIKINIEDLNNKNENLDKKLDLNYDELVEKIENKAKNLQKLINETFDHFNKTSISIENKSNQSENSVTKNDGKAIGKNKNENINNLLNKNKKLMLQFY